MAASWDEALGDIAMRLADIAVQHGPDKVLHTHYQGTCSAIACNFPERFFLRYGATEVDPGTICDRAGHVALEAMFGTSFEGFDPRTAAEANCLVLWGVNPSHSGPLMDRGWVRRFAGPTMVVDPVRTRTAEAAAGAPRLLSPAASWLMNSSYGNDPRIRAQPGESSLLLHADGAAARGIADGDLVRVRSKAGEVRLRAAISDRVRRGVAVSYKSPWPKYARDGVNLNRLNPGLRAGLGDSTAVNSLCVTVVPAGA